MEQHPIPQNISSYQFRLVGDMTLKQFFQLAGGALVSLLIYSLPVQPSILKWPFIIFFSLFGAALAFLPFEERPLEQWIAAFFRSVYSPTAYSWQKLTTPEQFFQAEGAVQEVTPTQIVHAAGTPAHQAALEQTEESFLKKMTDLFGATSIPTEAKMVVEETAPAPTPVPIPTNPETVTVGQTLTGQGLTAAQLAQFSPDAAPPLPPSQPNTVSGQVMDPDGHIVESAILEIQDADGRPVRALRSNKAGHFMIVTPLLNGKYAILTEKEGLMFEPLTFNATGNIIPPIAVKARGREVKAEVVN